MMQSRVTMGVVIVTYASRDLISGCLQSLRDDGLQADMTIHVVDNDSPDDTVDIVRERFPEVDLVARETNDGFAVANNVVLRDISTDYVLVLNPDAQVAQGTLDHLLSAMEGDSRIGMMGCRLLTADGSLDHAAKRAIPTPASALQYFLLRLLGKRGSSYVRPDIADDGVADVDAINGAFMLVRTSALKEVGLFDENYWMYGEDLDWCVRFRDCGWRIVYDGRVIAYHLKGGSTGGIRPPKLNYHFHRSMVTFYLHHQSQNKVMDAAVIVGIWVRFALTTISAGVIGVAGGRWT